MKTRSHNITLSVKEVEAAKALLQLKKACAPLAKNVWPSGRARRSTAGNVNYAETDI